MTEKILVLGLVLSILFFMSNSMSVFLSVTSGVLAGIIIGIVTEIYTSGDYRFVQSVAASSDTGAATVILSGLSLGMMSTGIPVLLICSSLFSTGIPGEQIIYTGCLIRVCLTQTMLSNKISFPGF